MGQVPLRPRRRPDPRGLRPPPDPTESEAGLSWEGLAICIGVDHRQLLRWRKKGAEPSGGAMLALVALAEQVPGGLDILMGRDLGVMSRGRE